MPASRVTVAREGARTTVRIAVPKSWTMIVFLLFWMAGWAAGEIASWHSLVSGQVRSSAVAYVGLWFVVWTLGGVFGVLGLLWAFAGHDLVTVEGGTLSVRRAAGPIGRTERFPLAEVRDLRHEPPTTGAGGKRPAPGALAFEHGKRTVRFGTYVDEPDARVALEALAPHVPPVRAAR